MATEDQPPEDRPADVEEHGSNISWRVSGPIVGSASSASGVNQVDASGKEVRGRDDFEDPIDVTITPEELLKSGIPEDHYVALAPGQDLKLTSRLDFHEAHRQAIFVGRGEIAVQDHVHGFHTWHFRLPNSHVEGAGSPVVDKVVVANIRKKAIGWKSLVSFHLVP